MYIQIVIYKGYKTMIRTEQFMQLKTKKKTIFWAFTKDKTFAPALPPRENNF